MVRILGILTYRQPVVQAKSAVCIRNDSALRLKFQLMNGNLVALSDIGCKERGGADVISAVMHWVYLD